MIAALAVLVLLAASLAWLVLGGSRRAATPARRRATADVDYAELEQAEQEVQEADDEHHVRDWGPGAPQKPLL